MQAGIFKAEIVKWFPERGFGFAKRSGSADKYFVHADHVIEGVLSLGAQIECELTDARDCHQRPEARRIRILK